MKNWKALLVEMWSLCNAEMACKTLYEHLQKEGKIHDRRSSKYYSLRELSLAPTSAFPPTPVLKASGSGLHRGFPDDEVEFSPPLVWITLAELDIA